MAGLYVGNSVRMLHAMPKPKRKLTAEQREAKRRRRAEFMTIFVNGKQKRVRRPPTIGGMDVDEFIRRNADPLWLHQNELWEYMIDETDTRGSQPGD
jgi:hypothetical protein